MSNHAFDAPYDLVRSQDTENPGKDHELQHPQRDQRTCHVAQLPEYINMIFPDELLIAVLANLDYAEMKVAASTCKRWHRVISDDGCWRTAFECYFGSLPVRRLGETSWKKEYLKRVQLLRAYQRGKHIVQFDPRIGNVDEFFIDRDEGRMLCGSLEKGMVAFCHPNTGRVEKMKIYFNEQAVPQQLSALLLDRHRVAAGIGSGLSLVTDFKDRVNYRTQRFFGSHNGHITCLTWVPNCPNLILSGGTDGCVRIWDILSARCMRILSGVVNRPIVTLSSDRRNHVVAANDEGTVFVWDLDLSTLLEASASLPTLIGTTTSTSRTFGHSEPGGRLVGFFYSAMERTAIVVLRLPEAYTSQIMKWDVRTGLPVCAFDGGHRAEVSAVAWDGTTTSDNRVLLCTGDIFGTVCVWDVPPPLPNGANAGSDPVTLKPIRIIEAHRASVSKLRIDAFKVVSTAIDGSAKVLDLLSGRCMRTLIVRRTRGGNDGLTTIGGGGAQDFQNRSVVRCLWAGRNAVIVATGEHVKSWDFGPNKSSGSSGKGKKKGSGGAVYARRGSHRWQANMADNERRLEIREQMEELRDEREYERQLETRARRLASKVNGVQISSIPSEHRMSEEELVEYTMLMSLEQDQTLDKDMLEALEKSLLDEHSIQLTDGPNSEFVEQKRSEPLDKASSSASSWSEIAEFGNRRSSNVTSLTSSVGSSRHSMQKIGDNDEELQYVLQLSMVEK